MRFRFPFLTAVTGLIMTGGKLLFSKRVLGLAALGFAASLFFVFDSASADTQTISGHYTKWQKKIPTYNPETSSVEVVLGPEYELRCLRSEVCLSDGHNDSEDAKYNGHGDYTDPVPHTHCTVPNKQHLLADDADCEPEDEPEDEAEEIADDGGDDGGGDEGCDQAATNRHDNGWRDSSFTDGHTVSRDHDSTSIDYCDHTQLVVVAARHTYIL